MNDTQTPKKTPDQVVQAIFALDLDIIKKQLCDKEHGEGWTVDQANFYEMEYKQFLALSVKYPDAFLSPSKNVDAFWHTHILNTRKYAEDCQNTFGYFVHHFPSARAGTAEEKTHYEKSFSQFQTLKRSEFGIPVGSGAPDGREEKEINHSAKEGAYCGLSGETGSKAGYCGVMAPQRKEEVAYCGLMSAAEKAAYCGMTSVASTEVAAYCGLASSQEKQEAAYCGLMSATETKSEAAYCGLSQASGNRAAYCGLMSSSDEEEVAYCGLATK